MTTDKSFYPRLIRLAIPISLQMLIIFAMNFSNNLMVGTMGEYSISGVYMGNQALTFLEVFTSGMVSAVLILCAQYWGRRDAKSIKIIAAMALRIIVALCMLFWAASFFFPEWLIGLFTPDTRVIAEGVVYIKIISFSYVFFGITQVLIATMQSVESVKVGLYISISTLVTNVLLNWVFIFGKLGIVPMGIAGSALATLISRALECAVIAVYVLKADKKLAFKVADFFQSNRLLFKDFLRYGTPIVAAMGVWAINTVAQNAIIGQYRVNAITAMNITNMMNQLVYVFIVGFSSALSVITSMTVGNGEFIRMRHYAKHAQVFFLLVGIVFGLAIFLLHETFISFYNIDKDAAVITRQFMMILSVTIVGSTYQASLLGGLVKAGGNTSFVLKNDSIFVFGVVLPSALIAMYAFHAPVWVVFLCLKSDQILKCIVAVIVINKFKWMRNLTRDNIMDDAIEISG